MKSIFKTIVCIIVCFILITIPFLIRTKLIQKEIDKGTKMSNNDPVVALLEEKVIKTNELRMGNLEYNTLSDEDYIHYVLYALNEDEYSIKHYQNDAGLCIVPNSVMFSTNYKCDIKVIKDEKIKEKIEEIFGESKDLNLEEFEYKENICKHDQDTLYCLINPEYVKKSQSYSVLYEAYEKKDEIYIYDYYLNINLNNKSKCLKYYSEEVCNNPTKTELPEVSEEKIKKNGTLYKHTFTKKEDKYYLTKSEVIK